MSNNSCLHCTLLTAHYRALSWPASAWRLVATLVTRLGPRRFLRPAPQVHAAACRARVLDLGSGYIVLCMMITDIGPEEEPQQLPHTALTDRDRDSGPGKYSWFRRSRSQARADHLQAVCGPDVTQHSANCQIFIFQRKRMAF